MRNLCKPSEGYCSQKLEQDVFNCSKSTTVFMFLHDTTVATSTNHNCILHKRDSSFQTSGRHLLQSMVQQDIQAKCTSGNDTKMKNQKFEIFNLPFESLTIEHTLTFESPIIEHSLTFVRGSITVWLTSCLTGWIQPSKQICC